MKVYNVVLYASLAVGLLIVVLIASIPFRFPHSTVSWESILVFGIPLFLLIALLLVKPILPLKPYRILLAAMAVLSVAATLTGYMLWVTLVCLFASLWALYVSRSKGLAKDTEAGRSNGFSR